MMIDMVRKTEHIRLPTVNTFIVLPVPSPGPPLSANLSTIIGPENLGISKHIPCVDDSIHSDGHARFPELLFCLDKHDNCQFTPPDSINVSVFDLSTSKLNAEVIDALLVKDAGPNGPVNGEPHHQ